MKKPKTRTQKILINLAVTLLFGLVSFYLTLPAINLHAEDFYVFVLILCVVYILCALVTSGLDLKGKGGFKASSSPSAFRWGSWWWHCWW